MISKCGIDVLPPGIDYRSSAASLRDQIVFESSEPFDTRGHFCDLFVGIHQTVGRVALKRLRHRGGVDLETMIRVSAAATFTDQSHHNYSLGSFSQKRKISG